MPFIASSIGRVTETSVCEAGASPLSTMMTMRGKSVCGKIATGSCQAAYKPAAQRSATISKIERDWFDTKAASFISRLLCQGDLERLFEIRDLTFHLAI